MNDAWYKQLSIWYSLLNRLYFTRNEYAGILRTIDKNDFFHELCGTADWKTALNHLSTRRLPRQLLFQLSRKRCRLLRYAQRFVRFRSAVRFRRWRRCPRVRRRLHNGFIGRRERRGRVESPEGSEVAGGGVRVRCVGQRGMSASEQSALLASDAGHCLARTLALQLHQNVTKRNELHLVHVALIL